jgi:hypothetical protein
LGTGERTHAETRRRGVGKEEREEKSGKRKEEARRG